MSIPDDLARHAITKIETALMLCALMDEAAQKEEFAVKVAMHIVGFAIGAVEDANRCTYRDAVLLLAERLVKGALASPPVKERVHVR